MSTRHGPAVEGGAERSGRDELHGTPRVRHDGATEHQAAQWVPDHLANRQRIGNRRPMSVGDVAKVLCAALGEAPPQEPSAAWCIRCQADWTERVDLYPRARIRADLSWSCDWCGRSGDALLTDEEARR